MLMSDRDITAAMQSGALSIEPFDQGKLSGASVDLCVGSEGYVSNRDDKVLLGADNAKPLVLNAGDFALVLSREKVKMPLDIAASIGMRSSLARKGVILLAGMQVDPGFEGHLRFGLYNASPRKVVLYHGDDLCTVEFHKLSQPATVPSPMIPELREGRIPSMDRDYLQTLEGTSLSELGQDLRMLTQEVKTLTVVAYRILIPALIAIFVAVIVAIFKR